MSATTEAISNSGIADAHGLLESSMLAALETYANVHRGSGPASAVTTHLYEKARDVVLNYLGLNRRKYLIVFCSPLRATKLVSIMEPGTYRLINSADIGLNLGIAALAVKQNALPKGIPPFTGGGTTRLYGSDWVMWAMAPDRYEAGTPAIINCIAFAKALLIIQQSGKDAFTKDGAKAITVDEILYNDAWEQLNGMDLLKKLRKDWIGHKLRVPTTNGLNKYINLDNSASTPAFEPVWQAFRKACQQPLEVREALIAEVKTIVSQTFGAPHGQYEVFFTSNATEAINLVADSMNLGASDSLNTRDDNLIVGSFLEHSSNDLPWRNVRRHTIIRLPVDKAGFFDLVALENLLRDYNESGLHGNKRISLVALSGASNITGTCNDLATIGNLTRRFGAQFLVDAAQLAAHRSIDMESLGIDYLAFSGHKMYAPFGTGVLIARKNLLNFRNEEMKHIQASGTENIGGIAALGKALILLKKIGFDTIEAEEQKLLRKALNGLADIKGIRIHGYAGSNESEIKQHTAVISFEIKNSLNSSLAKKLAGQGGIGTRYGCHCAHLLLKYLLDFSPTQDRIQRYVLKIIPILNLQGLLRVSFGLQNTENDVDQMLECLQQKGKLSSKIFNDYLDQRKSLVFD